MVCRYDTWQEKAILGVNCSIEQCDEAQETFWVEYGHTLVAALQQVPERHGAFLTNCPAHCQTGTGASRACGAQNWKCRNVSSERGRRVFHKLQLTLVSYRDSCRRRLERAEREWHVAGSGCRHLVQRDVAACPSPCAQDCVKTLGL